ncbi:ATP-dependent DNA helicase [Caloranaerobacter ferrireducens]|uniref:ATP-dependent DNA helicase n=1 Tax=Caloranaerobacter ferrireducens TaxID=1323370 RepID=UPI00084D0E94|nr:ATP-dependent DNA helicase [Caloranaerobacter ferrireducens]
MNSVNHIKISVRNLVSFVFKTGDIINIIKGKNRAVEGTKAHKRVRLMRDEDYQSEVPLKHIVNYNDTLIEISGRIDGLYKSDDKVVIEEIKSTYIDIHNENFKYNSLHLAQAKIYAYFYCLENNINSISIQLTYFQIDKEKYKSFFFDIGFKELEDFFNSIMDYFIKHYENYWNWIKIRDASLNELKFPFDSFRRGQRKLAVGVYRSILNHHKLFVCAPTGIGKTMGTIFPALKAMGEGICSKIFYLTAKNTTSTVVENSLEILRSNGLKLKSIVITAKDKICPMEETNCNPEYCELARGYFDKIDKAILDIFNEDDFSRDIIEKYAYKHKICPFEFSLDLSEWADIVICDYNYAFNPRVQLKRFFYDNYDKYVFLVDEAHNLVDRAREMFSAEINKSKFLELKRKTKDVSNEIFEITKTINSSLIKLRKECKNSEKKYLVKDNKPVEIYKLLKTFIDIVEKNLHQVKNEVFFNDLLEQYFEAINFIRIYELYSEKYVTYLANSKKDFKVKLMCLDPSENLNKITKRARSCIFFSASLIPIKYFFELLGGDIEDKILLLESPFPKDNFSLLINDTISTKYSKRELYYHEVAKLIKSLITKKTGNYIVFFPSYEYMDKVYEIFADKDNSFDIVKQIKDMQEFDRIEFLSLFTPNKERTLLGFAVMGGIFGEGIDLVGDRLNGVIIVGVGLPQLSSEREILRFYYNKLKGNGFHYAYIYPGFNRVIQAAGRLIRTESDRGIILLIDERFTTRVYKKLMPVEWNNYCIVKNIKELEDKVFKFWYK